MPTTKKRVNLSLPNDIESVLNFLAERDSVPMATKALELLKIALEVEEDVVLDQIVRERDKKGAKFVSHEKAWL